MSQADELLKYKQLLESGAITQEEFDSMKIKILGGQEEQKNKDTSDEYSSSQQSEQNYSNMNYGTTANSMQNSNVKAHSDLKPRKGMKIAGIVCAVFAIIYLIMIPSTGSAMVGMALFFAILAFMFVKLSKVPKSFKHIGKDDTGFKKNIFVIICIVVGFILVAATSGTSNSEDTDTSPIASDDADIVTDETIENVEETVAEEPAEPKLTVEVANDFERLLYDAVTDNSGVVTNIYFEEASDSNNQIASEYVEFYCENNEEIVQGILDKLVEVQKADATCAVCAVIKESEESSSNLIIADIDIEGNLIMTFESPNYNSSRNLWISGQFSAWDGSHTELTKLIKQNLNDEKSYDHINTSYRDIKTQEDADEINKILSDANYSQQVEIGDLFIMTEFSAKNGFNATVKNTAYGIAGYNNNSITLIGIE